MELLITAVSPVVKPVSQMWLAPGSTVSIQDVSWEEFESTVELAWQVGTVQALREFEGTLERSSF
ncbi:hypothetical protein [Nostoc sp. NZL]|uniref:hypothetical protein n=1 Tax=Nostoc sp. NZL TaxID=2650612 RepID=UPI0018C5D315|nr:hypothetical protein [Nostoc sp. NZL]